MVYHGREILQANPILKETVKPGPRALYGEGIYTSPDMVEKYYAQEFTRIQLFVICVDRREISNPRPELLL